MISSPKHQQGATLIGWVLILALVGMFGFIVIRLAPIYLEHYSVLEVLDAMKKDRDIVDAATPTQVMQRLKRHFNVNYIESVPQEGIRISKGGGVLKVEIKYEVRVPIIANVDAVVSFSDKLELKHR